ncbi:MAG: GatB/YqeY domain-containing protein [Acidimicrobiia bacterium]|nr:GatB/YqeY domain-containing protein [Acidimicrobiia bacterium]
MTIEERLVAEQTAAMKGGDRPTLSVIRQVRSEVSVARSAPGFTGEVDDQLYLSTISTYVKRMGKSKTEYEALGERGREQAEKLAFEIDYLSKYLPTKLDEAATRALVAKAIEETGATDPKMTGQVIGEVMKSGEEVDGALVARLVNAALNQ